MRFGYAKALPWVRRVDGGLIATAGPDALLLRGDPLPVAVDHRHVGEFDRRRRRPARLRADLVSVLPRPCPARSTWTAAIDRTEDWWQDWADSRCRTAGPADARGEPTVTPVAASLLRVLSPRGHRRHRRRGDHLAAGGVRRVPQLGLPLLLAAGRRADPGGAARPRLSRRGRGLAAVAAAGRRRRSRRTCRSCTASAGERDLPERELAHLPGYEGSTPVRIGNGAVTQFQADVIGEVMVALDTARRGGVTADGSRLAAAARAARPVAEHLGTARHRGSGRSAASRAFTHSAVMTWAAFDRGRARRCRLRPARPGRRVAADLRTRSAGRGRSSDGRRRRSGAPSRSTTAAAASTRRCCSWRRSASCAPDDPRMLGHGRGDRVRPDARRPGAALPHRGAGSTACRATSTRSWPARSGWWSSTRCTGRADDAATLMDRLLRARQRSRPAERGVRLRRPAATPATPRRPCRHLALVRAADALDDARAGRDGALRTGCTASRTGGPGMADRDG